MKKNTCALILGGYVNGYSIIQELYEKGIHDIILFDSIRNVASYSRKVKEFFLVEKNASSFYKALTNLHQKYEMVVVFPTDDQQLEILNEIYDNISSFCFLPFNNNNLLSCLDKYEQYKTCERCGVPYPKTIEIESKEDMDKILTIQFPIIIKPKKRDDLYTNVFRNKIIKNDMDYQKQKPIIIQFLNQGIIFLASEIVPGDGSNVYAYVGYRNSNGQILNEWTGKKLSQFPDDFGVFASASNQAPEIVRELGRRLLEELDLYGICEPEFKYDSRDNKFKLMEINLRSMMWHRTGNLSGVNLQYTQYLDAIGSETKKQEQEKVMDIHFIYLKHELVNLLRRKDYLNTFAYNLFRGNKNYFALWDKKDLKPFILDIFGILKKVGSLWSKR